MHNGKKHIVIISTALCFIVGVVACVNEDMDAQAEIGSRKLAVQSNGANATNLDAQAEIVSQKLFGTDVTADDSRSPCGYNTGFVDANGDGICDHAGQGGCQCQGLHGRRFIDEDRDGVCDHAGQAGCQCQGLPGQQFIDEDGDGVCDRAKTNGYGCRGRHLGRRGGMGNRPL